MKPFANPLLDIEILKLTTEEVTFLNALRISTSKFGLDKYYAITKYLEEGLCLYKSDNLWQVYITERGNEYNKEYYENCGEACIKVINIICDSQKKQKEVLIDFEQELIKLILNYDSNKKTLKDISIKKY